MDGKITPGHGRLRQRPWLAAGYFTGLLAALTCAAPMASEPPKTPMVITMDDNYPPYVLREADG